MRKYVHRVGRTARAGRDGHAWTLVEEQEVKYLLVQRYGILRCCFVGTLLQDHPPRGGSSGHCETDESIR